MYQLKKLKNIENLSYFDKNTISQYIDISDNSLYADIKRWLKTDVLIQLKKGLYVTNKYYNNVQNKDAYMEFIANKLRQPSYISLEYVLQKYSILTESIYAYTSVTLKSRRIYTNKFGTFLYREIKEPLFKGYTIKEYAGFEIKEATKAKALFDYLYLKNYKTQVIDKNLLLSYRFNLDEFKKNDLKEFSTYCESTNIKKFMDLPILLSKIYAI